jgi:cytochrome c-type biogenesis protein CcmH/NrfG
VADNPRIEELRRRVQADPASIAFAALAEEYRRAGRFEEAIEACRTGLQRHPSYLSARVTLGRSLLEVQNYDEARQELEHVLKAAPENLAAIRALAEIHDRRGAAPEALEHYKAALSVAQQEAAPPAPAPAIEWSLPKTAPPPAAVTLERIAVSVVQTPAPPAPAVPEQTRERQPEPQRLPDAQPQTDANKDVLEGLQRFLQSIQAARRSVSSEQPRVAVR